MLGNTSVSACWREIGIDPRDWCLDAYDRVCFGRSSFNLCAKYCYKSWNIHGRMPPVRRRKEQHMRERNRFQIYLGKIMDLWKEIKETVGLRLGDMSDAAFAKILLDRLVIYHLSASIIFILSRISKRITSGLCYVENPRRFYVFFLQYRRCRCDG